MGDIYRVIAIDGPAGSGKSTVARKLAAKLGFLHLNSGALYRALGREAEARGIPLDDDPALSRLASELNFEFRGEGGSEGRRIFVNQQDVSGLIAGEHAGRVASQIATLPRVREALTEVQRRIGKTASLVLEGRDAGTVVFPRADAKFYLDAPLEVRAERRFREFAGGGKTPGGVGEKVSLDRVKAEIAERDHRDSTRAIAPQSRATDAELVDTAGKDADQVVSCILESLRGRKIV